MTDYNDGKWHGWNGGECPVHPLSEVRIWDCNSQQDLQFPAQCAHWSFSGAFRVVKEYREPREWWLTNTIAHESEPAARRFRDELVAENPGVNFAPIVHVREVLE